MYESVARVEGACDLIFIHYFLYYIIVYIYSQPDCKSRPTNLEDFSYITALWNSLPQHLRALSSTSPTQTNNSLLSLPSSQFHKQLKTYLFLQSYPP